MSDQSDRIHQIIHDLSSELEEMSKKNEEKIVPTDVISEFMKKRVSSYNAGLAHYTEEAKVSIAVVFRRWMGAEPFSSAEDAIERTSVDAQRYMLNLFYKVFCDGIQLGQGTSHAVRKYRWFNKEDEIYDHDGFRQESELLAFRFASDYDTNELFERHWKGARQYVMDSTGFAQFDAKTANEKIWDFWVLVIMGGFSQLFMSGHTLGQQWAEESVLEGILNATAQSDGD